MSLLTLIVFALFLVAIWFFFKNTQKLGWTVLVALVLGIIFGLVIQNLNSDSLSTTLNWISIVGTGYVRLLQMIVMPLVFISILSAITKIDQASKLGRISVSVLAILLITTAISALIGILMVNVFHLTSEGLLAGSNELAAQSRVTQRAATVENLTVPGIILSFIPTNPFADLTGARPTSIIAVVIFSAFLGVAALSLRKENEDLGTRITNGVEVLNKLIMRVVRFVIRLTPYGVFALMIRMAATSVNLLPLLNFLIASYIAIFLMFIVHGILLSVNKINPFSYYKNVFPTLAFAFTSRSSAASIPLNVQTQEEKLGNNSVIANFSATFGATIGQNGCAGIYPAMLATMIAPTMGIDPLSVSFIASLILIVALASFGIAGVGGGATFASIVVLSTLGFPLELVGLLISIEPIIDMGRTALNVNGAMTAGTISSKWIYKTKLPNN
ncbi:L-cystine transporter [Psittacicella melopsittaci]|uniref:L-cystine transporter n=1 Tax=Psittacicella melopsittaci TaxID=2028576 RepID=A0A3A1Y5L5_9GAMM|nr:L-cystine transporter [Psittacicella melopsittaci]RIY32498.1 L-cystine transporter [Psittacicella melopsittaci]